MAALLVFPAFIGSCGRKTEILQDIDGSIGRFLSTIKKVIIGGRDQIESCIFDGLCPGIRETDAKHLSIIIISD